jgi:glycosyltransferase involved in cell wall biosynthesis
MGLRFFSLEKEMFKIPNKFIVTSNETKRLLLKEFEINKGLISVIEPGIERLIKTKKKFNQKHNLLTCGSIIERKNYLYLLNELMFMNNLTLNIIGDTSRDNYYYKKVITFIKKNKIENRVKIHSNVSKTKLSNLYSQCDLYVSVSKYEGFGMSLANAIIFKKPIITYKTTTLRNTLGSKGVVYFNDFKKNTLAKIINKILLNTKAFKELESQIIKNNRVFLTPLKSAKLFIKEVRNA